MEYKWVGNHPQDLVGGRVLAPGETVELTNEQLHDPHTETLIADGGLVPLDDTAENEATNARRRATRRENKTEDTPAGPGEQANPQEEEK